MKCSEIAGTKLEKLREALKLVFKNQQICVMSVVSWKPSIFYLTHDAVFIRSDEFRNLSVILMIYTSFTHKPGDVN